MPCNAYKAEGSPAAIRVDIGDQCCSCSCSIDTVVDKDDDVVVESLITGSMFFAEAYPVRIQPPSPKLILTTSSTNATDRLFAFGWIYRFDKRGIMA